LAVVDGIAARFVIAFPIDMPAHLLCSPKPKDGDEGDDVAVLLNRTRLRLVAAS
jgi:hypothetical protein